MGKGQVWHWHRKLSNKCVYCKTFLNYRIGQEKQIIIFFAKIYLLFSNAAFLVLKPLCKENLPPPSKKGQNL